MLATLGLGWVGLSMAEPQEYKEVRNIECPWGGLFTAGVIMSNPKHIGT